MASSLLESLALGKEDTRGFLIKDSVNCNGRKLLKSLVCHVMQRCSSVHVLLFDMDPARWSVGLPADTTLRLVLHEDFSDPHGWNNSRASAGLMQGECSYTRCVEVCGCEGGAESAVVLDSLSPLLLHHGTATVCRLLHALCQNCCCVVGLLHTDLHEDHVISQLSHVMPTTVHVTPTEHDPTLQRAHTVHQKKSGKILTRTELFSVEAHFTTIRATHEEETSALNTATDGTPPLDPAANLTFDLRLSSREKEARSRVVLPYTLQQHHAQSAAVGAGQIYYHPDEADDFDDSDPDDDLDV